MELVTTHPSGGYILEELHPGMAAEKVIHVSEERIRLFAEASDDFNPVHLDEAFGAIYISQTLGFHLPVRIGDDVVVRISVISVDQESARVELNCEGFVDGKLIMDGVAVVRVPRRRRPAKD